MKFVRNTHDENGKFREDLPRFMYLGEIGVWPTCDLNFISKDGSTIEEIYDGHREYDEQWDPEGYGFTMADILDGLAVHVRLGTVRFVRSDSI